ncbi:type IV secretory system conjugative DNA transfer family protein [Rhodococcus kroppenstedtii]|uniref:type IV secretory system conjugative DNA transfer family protein n=1 Tax=Rhodococcoides kroppenstedtii TaxID=293050 RepID=UPI001C9AC8A8|nr:TraM recognition domain-containing protein [Rhodococcus kroppenstedtii]MBY6438110.1 type IV secretory system conjugative DNA transfer family protein [Rhodococcus kroppenstedtii]
MSATVKDPTNDTAAQKLAAAAAGAAIVVGIGASVSLRWGSDLSDVRQEIPLNPLDVISQLYTGDLVWSRGATVVAVFFTLLLLILVGAISVVVARRRAGRTRVDGIAAHLASLKDVRSLTAQACRDTAANLGAPIEKGCVPGVPLGLMVRTNVPLYADIESTHIDIWGPRSGKTTSRVIPAVLGALGSVLTTSNKRDVVDTTRAFRAGIGTVRVFDPQKLANEDATFFWDPLSWVRSDTPTTMRVDGEAAENIFEDDAADASVQELKAAALAKQFADSDDGQLAKKDSFFDPEGEDLLASLFLAAAVSHRPITQTYRWVTDVRNLEPIDLLRDAGYELIADGLYAHYNATDKQRSGVFTTAKKMINSIKFRSRHAWIERSGPGDTRPEFDPAAFARSTTDTLYVLSKEGTGSVRPIVTALTVAVCDEILAHAATIKGGRLRTPFLFALDEVANVTRWTELPGLYSHFGSRGIIIMSILQSWSQGVRCWGQDGMSALWGAANVKVYGGGVAVDDGPFLRNMSIALGDHYELTGSVSTGRGGSSQSQQRSKIRTIDEADLESLPRGRAIIRSSGNRPVLVKTIPWMKGPHAKAVQAANAAHDKARDVASINHTGEAPPL